MKQHTNYIFICFFLFLSCTNNSDQQTTTSTSDSITDTVVQTNTTMPEATNDAVSVAPNHYRVLSDSLGIRIVEVTYQPGDSVALHSHPEAAYYVVEGDKGIFTEADGAQSERTLKPGMAGIRPSETHAVKNTGTKPFKIVLVEVSRAAGAAADRAEPDANKVASQLYKIKADSLGLRILEINYKPGQSSAMHAHPDAALYVIEGSTSEFTMEDGKKESYTLSPGMTRIMPGGKHSVKNVGKTTTKAILVEVFRNR